MYLRVLYFLLLPAYLGAAIFAPRYEQAVEQAQQQKKNLLLFFNGSDCSGLGMKMKREVLETQEFEKLIGHAFICYEVDFPEHSALDDKTLACHQHLKEKFHIEQIPALVLIGPDEKEIVRMGYLPTTAQELATDLLQLSSADSIVHLRLAKLTALSFEELCQTYEMALTLQQPEVVEQILEVGVQNHNSGFFLLEQYRHLAQMGKQASEKAKSIKHRLFTLDPNNQNGYQYNLALIDFQALASVNPPLEPEAIVKPLTDYLYQFGKQDVVNVWQIEMMIAQFFLDKDYWNTALKHAELAHNQAPIDKQQEIAPILEYIRAQAAQVVSN